jgi:hypothetical protein
LYELNRGIEVAIAIGKEHQRRLKSKTNRSPRRFSYCKSLLSQWGEEP